ncbi:MAG: glucokinase [Gammaproteobacteria bacterium]|nr:glucokinase [Gammaproteobacteria bacterium]
MSFLLADIGGTNTRCAVTHSEGKVEKIQSFRNSEFSNPETLLGTYLHSLAVGQRPDQAMLAVAAPIRGDAVNMINIDWQFSVRSLQNQLSLQRLHLLNDFEALARALPEFNDDDLLKIGAGAAETDKPKAVLGPGTGLGVAALIPVSSGWQAISGEGGHVSLPPANQEEARIILRVQEQYGHCSAERLLSGPGLSLLHSISHESEIVPAEEIGRLAMQGDRQANASLELFFQLLGSVAANLALTFGAFGGIYIGGGIIPKHADQFAKSGFRERFEAKGRYGDYLRSIATYLIVADYPTLTGLAACARDSVSTSN